LPGDILNLPSTKVWYLYEKYLELVTHVSNQSPSPIPELVTDYDDDLANWAETTAPPDWKIKRIIAEMRKIGRTDDEIVSECFENHRIPRKIVLNIIKEG